MNICAVKTIEELFILMRKMGEKGLPYVTNSEKINKRIRKTKFYKLLFGMEASGFR